MPRPKPRPGHSTVQMTLSVPESVRDAFVQAASAEAEAEGTYVYGAQSALFRKMFRHWEHGADLRAQLRESEKRRRYVERLLLNIRESLANV